ncbi:MAG: hypothetical protein IT373_09500 [Polyangiaceae bacterium]|nr:hypothetical protein [Polyangiaceae bacterium]
MSSRIHFLLVLQASLTFTPLAACAPPFGERDVATLAARAPTRPAPPGRGDGPALASAALAAPLVAGVAGAELALVDPSTGLVGARAATGGQVRELAFDAVRGALFSFEADADGEAGTVARYRVEPAPSEGAGAGGGAGAEDELARATLSAREVRGWLEGRARLAPVAAGLVVLAEGYGSAWRLWSDEGPALPSAPAPAPQSLWVTSGDGPDELGALAHRDGELVLARATVADGLGAVHTLGLGPSLAAPPTARAVARGDEVVVVDRDGDDLVVGTSSGGELEETGRLTVPGARVLDAAWLAADGAVDGAPGPMLALVLDEPASAALVVLDAAGSPQAACQAPLDAPLDAGDGLGVRALVTWGGRHLFVAGRDRAWQLRAEVGATGCTLELEGVVAGLGAPIAALR